MGVRFKNNTGNLCTGVKVSYAGYQLSLAENGLNINKLKFSYKTSNAAITSLLGTGWNMVPSLDYIAPNNSAISGGNQISAYVCNVSSAVSGCIVSGLSVANGDEIMFRWGDLNNAFNDLHLAIDDVKIEFFSNAVCTTVLPIELLDFYATKNNSVNDVVWKVAEERDINYYKVEKSDDGMKFTEMNIVYPNNQQGIKTYSIVDENPFSDITYYKLSTKEMNGEEVNHEIVALDTKNKNWNYSHYQSKEQLVIDFKNNVPKYSSISLYDVSGKLISTTEISSTQTIINTNHFSSGIYFVQIATPYKTENFKVAIE